MKIGSLFSGVGGLDLGLERAGLGQVIWQVESDPFCRKVLKKHWPKADQFVDVRGVIGRHRQHTPIRKEVPEELSAVDLICGGFP